MSSRFMTCCRSDFEQMCRINTLIFSIFFSLSARSYSAFWGRLWVNYLTRWGMNKIIYILSATFSNDNHCVFMQMTGKFILKVLVDYKSILGMAWQGPGDKALPELWMNQFTRNILRHRAHSIVSPVHVCLTRALCTWIIALITAQITNDIRFNQVWDEITYPFPNFNRCTAKVWECITNFTPHLIMVVITYLLKLRSINPC